MRASSLLAVLLPLGLLAAPGFAERYLAFGDSVTEGFGDDATRAELGYPPRLEELLHQGPDPAAVVENHGMSGETTPEGLIRLDSVLDRGGDALLLMEGTNDISLGISPETTRFNLFEMARRAESRNLEVVHGTIIPRSPGANRDSDNFQTRAIAQQIRDLAGSRSRRLVDPFEIISVIPNVFANEYYNGGVDAVGHPNALGYDRIARAFRDVLAGIDTVPPVVGVQDPADSQTGVSRNAEIFFDLWDFGTGLDIDSIELFIDGARVPATVRGGGRAAEVSYRPPNPFGGAVRVSLSAQDLASPANALSQRRIATFLITGFRYLEGDVNQDGRVDGSDLVRFGLAFGASRGEERYNGRADANHDDLVDGSDLALLAANFGRTGP